MAGLAMAFLVHGFIFFLAIVVFYAGLGVGLASSSDRWVSRSVRTRLP